jgi:hypothetical protein
LPHQLKSQGAKCSINPIPINMIPAVMIQRAIVFLCLYHEHRCTKKRHDICKIIIYL